jgi:hypothetical protein
MRTLCLVLALAFPTLASAQAYSIDWFSIDGGGGTSSGGAYSLSGTIGQPDAGVALAGGPYTLLGGFWSVIAAIGSPEITITRSVMMGDVTISWVAAGFVLEETSSLNTTPGSWTLVNPTTYQTNGEETFIVVPGPTSGHRFYRLRRNP